MEKEVPLRTVLSGTITNRGNVFKSKRGRRLFYYSDTRRVYYMRRRSDNGKAHRLQLLRRVTVIILTVLLMLSSVFLHVPVSASDVGSTACDPEKSGEKDCAGK